MDSFDHAHAFFNTDRFRYLVQLKCLHLYRERLACFYSELAGRIGIVLSYPTNTTAWDQANYSHTRSVLLPVASDTSAAEMLLQHIRETFNTTEPLVFKFCDTTTRNIFTAALALRPAKTFISYTSHINQHFEPVPMVNVSRSLERACYDLYVANGYTPTELDHAASEGAFSVTRYADGIPVSACFVFRNFDDIWEIAGVHTTTAAQRQGYAQAVVQTALHIIQSRGNLPRYQAENTNVPSIRLAEKLRLSQCLRFEHFILKGDECSG